PGAVQAGSKALPSTALADAVRGSVTAGLAVPGRAWAVLAAWAVAAPVAAARWFRWEYPEPCPLFVNAGGGAAGGVDSGGGRASCGPRAAHGAPRAAPVARRGPRAVRGAERRPHGDGAPPEAADPGGERRPDRRDRGADRGARLGPVGHRGGGDRRPRGLRRPVARPVRGALHAGRRGGLAAGRRPLGPRLRHRGRPSRAGRRVRAPRPRRDRVDDLAGQRALAAGDAAPRHDPRPGRRLRPPSPPRGPPPRAPRPLPAAPHRRADRPLTTAPAGSTTRWGADASRGENGDGRPGRAAVHHELVRRSGDQTKAEAKIRATIVITLMRMFMEGPEVSLKGSPTVSPTTAALCGSEPLPPWAPASMYFLALSQAPPALAMKMASAKPTTRAPARKPPRAFTSMKPITRGITTARPPGISISLSAAPVEMSTHLAYSGSTPSLPSRRPGISRNWRRTSSIILLAARPTASIVRAAKTKGSMAPRKR